MGSIPTFWHPTGLGCHQPRGSYLLLSWGNPNIGNFVKIGVKMRPPKINDRRLLQLIDKENLSYAEAARRLDVSRQAVSHRMKELRPKTTRVIAASKIKNCVDQRLDAVSQLKIINDNVISMLNQANGDPELSLKGTGWQSLDFNWFRF
jgi:predicted DNA-binding protein (UPF0251 family)